MKRASEENEKGKCAHRSVELMDGVTAFSPRKLWRENMRLDIAEKKEVRKKSFERGVDWSLLHRLRAEVEVRGGQVASG